MADLNNPHFDKLFWFCCFLEFLGVLLMAALIWIPVPHENQPMANIAMGFDTATLLVVPIGYLLGGNPTGSKQAQNKIANVEQLDSKTEIYNGENKNNSA